MAEVDTKSGHQGFQWIKSQILAFRLIFVPKT